MQGNPVAFSLFLMCGLPIAIFMIGFWVGRGGPLPGGRRFVIGVHNGRGITPYDDE
jgi:hypothetical protein